MTSIKEHDQYRSPTWIGRQHGMTGGQVRKLLKEAGLLGDGRLPSSAALADGTARVFETDEGAPFAGPGELYVKWDRLRIAPIIEASGQTRHQDALPRDKYDVIRCTKSFVTEARRSLACEHDEVWPLRLPGANMYIRGRFCYLVDCGQSLFLNLAHDNFPKVAHELSEAQSWLRRKRKIADHDAYQTALEISDGVLQYLEKRISRLPKAVRDEMSAD